MSWTHVAVLASRCSVLVFSFPTKDVRDAFVVAIPGYVQFFKSFALNSSKNNWIVE